MAKLITKHYVGYFSENMTGWQMVYKDCSYSW